MEYRIIILQIKKISGTRKSRVKDNPVNIISIHNLESKNLILITKGNVAKRKWKLLILDPQIRKEVTKKVNEGRHKIDQEMKT